MPDNIATALAMAIGIGIIDISIGITTLFLRKAVNRISVADSIAGWSAFVILSISAFGAMCFFITILGG